MRILFVMLFLTTASCDYSDSRLVIKNNSKDTVVFDYAMDTLLEETTDEGINYILENAIQPQSEEIQRILGVKDWWGAIIKDSKNKKLNVFIS